MPEEVKQYVASKGIVQREYTSLDAVLQESDVIYMTRIQRERFTSETEYNQHVQQSQAFTITTQRMSQAKQRMIVMHPLPRLNEIS